MSATKLQDFDGKWTLCESENFDDFLKLMGAPYLVRKVVCSLTPTITITVEDNKLTTQDMPTFLDRMTVVMPAGPIKPAPQVYIVGEETDVCFNTTPTKCKSSFVDGVMTSECEPVKPEDAKKKQTIKREIVDDKFVMTMITDSVTCKRIFKRASP